MITFSPGLLQGCFELLEIVQSRDLLIEQICPSFATLGPLKSPTVLESGQLLNWIVADAAGYAELTSFGNEILAEPGYDKRLRIAIAHYVEIVRPPWLQNATYGRDRVLSFVSSDIGQVFVEANLVAGTSDEIVAFWDDLGARARGLRNERLTEIGRQGERLSIEYERRRTGQEPKWVSIEDNADGYDLLSIISSTDNRYLPIEVKASTQGRAGQFHLTVTEWTRSLESDVHEFHLWDLSADDPQLAVLTVDEVSGHVPSNLGNGEWQLVQIPFATFRENFEALP